MKVPVLGKMLEKGFLVPAVDLCIEFKWIGPNIPTQEEVQSDVTLQRAAKIVDVEYQEGDWIRTQGTTGLAAFMHPNHVYFYMRTHENGDGQVDCE
jgi:hypothetical protein